MIIVVVDRLTKIRYYILYKKDIKTQDQAFLFIRDIWKLYGLPESIISNRGTTFVNVFWDIICS
jgi:hypothetical protein